MREIEYLDLDDILGLVRALNIGPVRDAACSTPQLRDHAPTRSVKTPTPPSASRLPLSCIR